jgi:ABC-type transport system substrate-binding protein
MRRRSLCRAVLVICAAWALLTAACSGDDATPSTNTGGAVTTIPATTTSATTSTTATTAPTTTTAPPAVARPYGGVARVFAWGSTPFTSLNPFIEWNKVGDAYQVGISRTSYAPCGSGEGARWCTEQVPYVLTQLPSFTNGGLVENPDGTVTIRLEIRPEAVWEDGVPISGDDLAFTYQLLTIYDLSAVGSYEVRADGVDPESLVVGPKSLEFTLTTPDTGWMRIFEVIVPRHDVEGSDFLTDWNDRMWVSGGPFRFESRQDDYLVFSRNPDYWRVDPETGEQLPYLDRIEVGYFNAELIPAVLEAASPEIHGLVECFFDFECSGTLEPEELSMLQDLYGQAQVDGLRTGVLDAYELEPGPFPETLLNELVAALYDADGVDGGVLETQNWENLGFNMGPGRLGVNEDSWNEHLDFRRAVAYALDRDRVAEAAFGFPWRRLDSYVELFSPALSNTPWDRYVYDPGRARGLLAGLCDELDRDCDTDPPRLVLSRAAWQAHRQNTADEIAAQLEDVGIDVEISDGVINGGPLDWGCGLYDTMLLAWFHNFGLDELVTMNGQYDPARPPIVATGGLSGNGSRWGAPAVAGIEDDPATDWIDESCLNSGPSAVIDEHTDRMTQVLAEMRTTMDIERLQPLIAEAEDILADQVVFIPLYTYPTWLFWNTGLAGVGMNVYNYGDLLWNCEEWYRTDL